MDISQELQDKVDTVCRQTNYTSEVAIQKLEEHNNNVMNVIKDYLGVSRQTQKPKSLNQQIYTELRGFMDDIQTQYDIRKQQQENAIKD